MSGSAHTSDSPGALAVRRDPMSRRAALRTTVLVVGVLATVVAAQLLRQRGHPAWDTVYADDGVGFLVAQWRTAPWSLVGRSYGGYLDVGPRLAAIPVRVLPHAWGAAYLAVAGALALALLGWFVAIASRDLVRPSALCWFLGLAVVFAPAVGRETMNEISELQFPLLFATFWAVITTQRSRSMITARSVVVFLAVTSSPLGLLAVPVSAVLAAYRRSRADFIVLGSLGVGSLLQGITLLVVPTPKALGPRTLSGFTSVYRQRVLESWLVGDGWLRTAVIQHRHLLELSTPIIVGMIIVALFATTRTTQWLWALFAFAASVVVLAASAWARGLMPIFVATDELARFDGARYFLVPFWLFLSGLVLLAGGPRRLGASWERRLVAAGSVLIVLHFVVLAGVGFRVGNVRSPGPAYAAQLRAIRVQCARKKPRSAVLYYSPPSFSSIVRCQDA